MKPIALFLRILIVVGVVEFLIMNALSRLGIRSGPGEDLLNAGLLILISGPALYLWVIRPVVRHLSLRAAEGKYRGLVQELDAIFWEADPVTWRFTFVSPRAEAILGYPVEDWLTQPDFWVQMLHPEDREKTVASCQAALSKGLDHEAEYRVTARDGHTVWVYERIRAHRGLSGSAARMTGLMVDITGRKKAEEALRKSEETNRAMLDGVPDMMFRLDSRGVFLDFKAAKDFVPLVPSEIFMGRNVREMMPAPLGDRLGDHVEIAARTGQAQRVEYQVQAAGEPRDFEARIVPLAGGEVIAMVRDVTDHRRAAKALAASERHLRTIIEAEPECVKLVALDGTVLEMNRAGLRMMEADHPDQVIGKSIYPPLPPDHLSAYRDLMDRVGRGESGGLEFELVGLKGARRWLETHAVPFRNQNDEVVAMLGITRDISERKHLEAQLRQAHKMEAVGRLAGGIAHDFNNLLQVVTGQCDLLLTGPCEGPSVRMGIEEVQKASKRAAALVRQLLAFSRRQELSPRVLDLNDVVEGVTEMLRRLIGEDVELCADLQPGLWPVQVDPVQIEQVILNLAINARDAMPEGGRLGIVTRNVAVDGDSPERATLPAGPCISLTVTDTGHGMDEQTMARVFDPFFTTKEVGKGTGLGLAMAYGIVRESGGTIDVSSAPGMGASFRVYLPRTEAPPADPASPPPPIHLEGTETILVVEDEAQVRKLIGRILRRQGYAVVEASDGSEAIRLAEGHEGPIHLVVTDVVMPRLGGPELARRLLRLNPALKVLYVSGHNLDDLSRLGAHHASAGLLFKPFTPEALAVQVRRILTEQGIPGEKA